MREDLALIRERIKRCEQRQDYDDYHKAVMEEQEMVQKLNRSLAGVDQYELRIANALWGEKTYPFRDSYIEEMDEYYKTGGIYSSDFINDFPAERKRINNWVSDQTKGKITDIIPQLSPDQTRLLRLILTNTIYFKGQWLKPFDETETRPREFSLPGGKKVLAPIMYAGGLESPKYGAFEEDGSFFKTPGETSPEQKSGFYPGSRGFAMLELPYKGEEFALILIAPNSPEGLEAVEKKLSARRLSSWMDKLEKRKVNVYLPRFKLETEYSLKKSLRSMGMARAFTDPRLPDGADFGEMCASSDPMLQLYISEILHKAYLEVNEKGTEAAAATAALMLETGAYRPSIPFIPTFRADRPFFFMIRHNPEGSILFMGRVVNPGGLE
jgi:serine protease inhibitor